jgi:hypothetical protein
MAGLIFREVYKLRQGHRNIELYRNKFVDLAMPFFEFSKLKSLTQRRVGTNNGIDYEVNINMTIEEFIEYFKVTKDNCIFIMNNLNFRTNIN